MAYEKNVAFEIAELVSDLRAAWERMQISSRQALVSQEWLRVSRIRYTAPSPSGSNQDWLLLALTDLQSAMRAHVDSVTDLSESIADYNVFPAELKQAEGTAVYSWRDGRDESVVPTEAMVLPGIGGHVGPAYVDYRNQPAMTLQNLNSAPRAPQVGLPAGVPVAPTFDGGNPAPAQGSATAVSYGRFNAPTAPSSPDEAK
jgi:hypothetical protein